MGNLFRSWFFFTALLLFLLTAAVSFPELRTHLFGHTEQALEQTVDNMEAQVQEVWARLNP